MIALELAQLLELHRRVMDQTGGSSSIRDMNRLEAAIASQTQHLFGKESYPSIVQKAAALMRGIIADHPFVDGNKRTAVLAGLTLLAVNGFIFRAEPGELENFAVRVATEHLDVSDISVWVEAHEER